MSRPTEIDVEDILRAVRVPHWPPFLVQFRDFIRLNRLHARAGGGYLIRCRFCVLTMAMDWDYEPSASPDPLLYLAAHGLFHAANGDLTHFGPRR